MVAQDAPVSTQSALWQGPTGGGIVGFIVLVLDIIAWAMSATILQHCPLRLSAVSRNRTVSLTCLPRGGDHPIEPSAYEQGHLVLRRLPLPRSRHDHLVPLLQLCTAQLWWIRGHPLVGAGCH